jgi:hypothetical protein
MPRRARRHSPLSALLVLFPSLAVGACAQDLTGILAADTTGDMISPLAPRRDALLEVRDACGAAGETSGAIVRAPYVQAVTTSSARVSWTSTAESGELLELWAPRSAHGGSEHGGSEHRPLGAEVEATRYLRAATQWGVAIDGLEAAHTYCYLLRAASGDVVYGPIGFRTAPLADAATTVHFAVLGDSGSGSSDQAAVAEQLAGVPLDLVLHVGDLAYADGRLSELEANHFAMYEAFGGAIPLFPAIGDHDDATDHAGPFREVFTLPTTGGAAASERWYSLDWGPLHVVVLDALRMSSTQLAWLDADLAASDRAFTVAVLSVPLYSSGFHGGNGDLRRALEPILFRHGVDLVVVGDDHHYERTIPIGGVTHIVTGGGGRSVRPVGSSDFTAFAVTAFHFLHVEASQETLRVHAIDATGREFDGVEIARR